MNPNAASWTPPGAAAAAPAAETEEALAVAAPAAPAAAAAAAVPPEPPVEGEEEGVEGEEEEEIDEDDPLWQAVLRIAEGDREKARRMLEDPDALMVYPEVRAAMGMGGGEGEEGEAEGEREGGTDDDWEKVGPEDAEEEEEEEEPVKSEGTEGKAVEGEGENEGEGDEEEAAVATGAAAAAAEGEGDLREHLNLVFIGHVDAGKSTLSGNILYLTNNVDTRTIERYEREAKQRNRESWFLAFIMDTNEEERAKGKTVEVGRAHFDTEARRYTILDAPGHKNYVPNMISGAAQADVGILVISARRGEFETGFERGGQTREHALLAKTLGVNSLVVVINKMDDPTVEWEQSRFEECVTKLKPFLKSCGYTIRKDVRFIPISGLTGANILNEVDASVCPWWRDSYGSGQHNTTDPTLLSCLDRLTISGRDPAAPLRMPVLDRYAERGTNVLGKVESGTIHVGDTLTIMPTSQPSRVEALYINDEPVTAARPGENVRVKVPAGLDEVQKGFVICGADEPCRAVHRFRAQVALVDMLEHRPIFSSGYGCMVHAHTVEEDVVVTRLISVADRKGQPTRARFAKQGQMAVVELEVNQSVCVEEFSRMPQLGRFTLRDEGKTIAIGKVTELSD